MKKVWIKATLVLLILMLCAVILSSCSDSSDTSTELAAKIAKVAYAKLNEHNSGAPKALLKEDTTNYPSSFDLRKFHINNDETNTFNVVAPVGDQGDWGCCWSFATISACESSLMSQRKIDSTTKDAIELSELHLAYFGYDYQRTNENGQQGEGAHCTTTVAVPISTRLDVGGYADLSASVIANGIGPIEYTFAPYNDKNDWTVDQNLKYKSYAILSDANYLEPPASNNEDGIKAVKSELLKGHAVAIGYHAPNDSEENSKYYNSETYAYYSYDSTPSDSNHEVCIVGWDDSYYKDDTGKIKFLKDPGKPGAWIVKNSWGTGWGDSGYFYLSYCEPSIDESETYEFADLSEAPATKSIINEGQTNQYEEFSYDYLPYYTDDVITITTSDLNAGSIKLANVYQNTTGKTLTLKDVSYTTAAANSDVTWEIYVYDGSTSSAKSILKTQSPDSTKKIENITYRGFHRVSLDKALTVKPGQCVIIAVTEVSNDSYILGFTVNIGEDSSDKYNDIYFEGVCNSGESLVCVDDQWADWSEVISNIKTNTHNEFAFDNLKIKGFASFN